MKSVHRRSLTGACLAFAAALACVTGLSPASSAAPVKITVFAAASLKDALDTIAVKWRAETGNATAISYAASSTLAKQIENGAPADLFISADLDWMDYLQQHNLIDVSTRANLLRNKLVLIAPQDSTAKVEIKPGFPLARLLGSGRLAIGEPSSVPAGKYGKAALTKLGVWDSVAGHIAAAESVRAALVLVARGEAPFGIVYQTDAAVEKSVKIVGVFPPDTHPAITYPMALTKSGNQAAASLEKYLHSKAAAEIFTAQGFVVLDGEK